MARTEIHQISTTLNIAIDYIIDPEKTDDQRLCSTYECTLQCATMDFEDVRLQGTGRTTVLAEHIWICRVQGQSSAFCIIVSSC